MGARMTLVAWTVATALTAATAGETPSQINSVPRSLDVSQFGVPRDSTFIFCDGQDCAGRTKKTLAEPRGVQRDRGPETRSPIRPLLAAPVTAVQPAELVNPRVEPAPDATYRPKHELSRAKVAPPVKKKPTRRRAGKQPKQAPKQICVPEPTAAGLGH